MCLFILSSAPKALATIFNIFFCFFTVVFSLSGTSSKRSIMDFLMSNHYFVFFNKFTITLHRMFYSLMNSKLFVIMESPVSLNKLLHRMCLFFYLLHMMLLGDVTFDGRYGFLANCDYVMLFCSCGYSFFSLFIGIYSCFN